ncbi:MAG: M23 family metallopeptidase [Geobacteraceae bacterium]|nr:M23 family metallopeptidase [Geobacteraceae bacterium]
MNQQKATFRIQICLLLATCCMLLSSRMAQADIYRFVTIDGVESFTDSPMQKGAQVVVKDPTKNLRKKTARSLSKETNQAPAPSLKEIIEKTVQAQVNPEHNKSETVETVLPVNGTITSGVGIRVDPIDGQLRHHNGIDIAVPEGTPVHSVAAGVVVYAGLRSGYGLTVLVEHDNGMITLCGHNSKLMVTQGQTVKKGETIALAGSTGRSTGPHVHFEAWQSGNNITAAFMPNSTMKIAAVSHQSRQRVHFRKEVLSDGSLLITNIPTSIP